MLRRAVFPSASSMSSGPDDVGELEYHVGDRQDDVDRLLGRARIALEVDAALDGLIGWNDDCLKDAGSLQRARLLPARPFVWLPRTR